MPLNIFSSHIPFVDCDEFLSIKKNRLVPKEFKRPIFLSFCALIDAKKIPHGSFHYQDFGEVKKMLSAGPWG